VFSCTDQIKTTNKVYNLNIVIWNANGIKNKTDELKDFLDTEQTDIILISETKLTTNDKIYFDGYSTYRRDRPTNTRAGGVAIIIKRDIAHKIIKNNPTSSIETLSIKLANNTTITAALQQTRQQILATRPTTTF
jgi:exonuclease III